MVAIQKLNSFRDALQLSSHVLVRSPSQLTGQMIGRLGDGEHLRTYHKPGHEKAWYCPLTASLSTTRGALKRTLDGDRWMITSLAVTPDGSQVVSVGVYPEIIIWDFKTGEVLYTPKEYYHQVKTVAAAPDGKRAVTGARDCTLKVWDLESGKSVMTLEGHRDSVYSLAITPDGKTVVVGDEAGKVHFLRLANVLLGPLIVTARWKDKGLSSRCPAC